MSTERIVRQSGFFNGGQLAGGLELFPLSIDRLDIIRDHVLSVEKDGSRATRLAMAVYATPADGLAKLDSPEAVARRMKKVGDVHIADFQQFARIFDGDLTAIESSQVKDSGPELEDGATGEAPGK